jgi:hypothetical protein
VRQAWALLRLGPCVEVYSEGDLLGGARTSVGQTPFKVRTSIQFLFILDLSMRWIMRWATVFGVCHSLFNRRGMRYLTIGR